MLNICKNFKSTFCYKKFFLKNELRVNIALMNFNEQYSQYCTFPHQKGYFYDNFAA
jgi:hypothetical protein